MTVHKIMSQHHIIISQDSMLRQLVCGILRKHALEVTEAANLDDASLNTSALLILDMGDDAAHAQNLWQTCTAHNLSSRTFILCAPDHPLYAEITAQYSAQRIVPKPLTPDALYNALSTTESTPTPATAPAPTDTHNHDEGFFTGEDIAPPAPEPAPQTAPAAPGQPAQTPSTPSAIDNAVPEQDNRTTFMKHVLDLSFQKMREDRCAPFAAAIVKDGKIIAEGWSEVLTKKDPTAHAEMNAIRKATADQQHHRLRDCEIYCSTEPCPMCLSAIYLSGISKIYFANSFRDAEEFGFEHSTITAELGMSRNERIVPAIQLMEDEAFFALEEWKNTYSPSGYEE